MVRLISTFHCSGCYREFACFYFFPHLSTSSLPIQELLVSVHSNSEKIKFHLFLSGKGKIGKEMRESTENSTCQTCFAANYYFSKGMLCSLVLHKVPSTQHMHSILIVYMSLNSALARISCQGLFFHCSAKSINMTSMCRQCHTELFN